MPSTIRSPIKPKRVLLSSKQQRLKDTVCITMSSVWVQLYYKGEAKPVEDADPIKIKPIPEDVSDLKEKVIEKAKTMLGVQVYNLFIYPVGTVPPVSNDTEYLQANTPGAEAAEGSSYEKPLIVIAPKPEQPNGSRVGEKWETLPSPQIPSKPNEGNFLDVQLLNKAGLVREGENELLFCRLDTLRLWKELCAWSSPTEDGRSVVGLVRGPPGTGT
jgi:hypothetical protein